MYLYTIQTIVKAVKKVAQLIRGGQRRGCRFCILFCICQRGGAADKEGGKGGNIQEMIGLVLGYASNCWLLCPRSNIQVDM